MRDLSDFHAAEHSPFDRTAPKSAPALPVSEAERLYWVSLEAASKQRAQELEIKGWGTGTDGPGNKAKICDVYYFHTDQVGLPEELSNDRGNLVWHASYKTWGNTVSEDWSVVSLYGAKVDESYRGDTPKGDAKQQNLRFQGQYLDRDTGLHYNTFRYYDPDIGRFISPDPIGLDGGINLGTYSPNPISWVDPWGLSCSSDAKELAENLGNRPNADYRAHHIVMSNSKDPRMVTLRDKMSDLGIPINDSQNGIWLPKNADSRLPGNSSTAHAGEGVHGNAYKQYVFDKLSNAKTAADFNAGLAQVQGDLAGGKVFKTQR